MALFDSNAEKQRKLNLKALEDKRLKFAEELHALGYRSERALYSQHEGGFRGVAIGAGQFLYITAPGPGDDADFSVKAIPRLALQKEDVLIPSEGIGGILGFGKRGGVGYKLKLIFPDGELGEIDFVSSLNCFFEHDNGTDPLFSLRRRRGDANVVWEFRPIDPSRVKAIIDRWTDILEANP